MWLIGNEIQTKSKRSKCLHIIWVKVISSVPASTRKGIPIILYMHGCICKELSQLFFYWLIRYYWCWLVSCIWFSIQSNWIVLATTLDHKKKMPLKVLKAYFKSWPSGNVLHSYVQGNSTTESTSETSKTVTKLPTTTSKILSLDIILVSFRQVLCVTACEKNRDKSKRIFTALLERRRL